jgi:hypothetical protein
MKENITIEMNVKLRDATEPKVNVMENVIIEFYAVELLILINLIYEYELK